MFCKIGRIPHPVVFGTLGAIGNAASTYRIQIPSACCSSGSNSADQSTPRKYEYLDNPKITAPPSTLNKSCESIQEFFASNPAMTNLTRICADLSNIIYCATDDTHPSKELLMNEISKCLIHNPLLSQLELVDSWRDGAVFRHKESKLLFCVARGTEMSLTTTCIRDLINDAMLLAGAPAQSRLMSFIDRVNAAKKLYPDYLVLTTGHSLGGAIANDYAIHHPGSYSIVFSPGGTSADRNNNDPESKTWLTSNPNIVAFKPSNDQITRWFDCPGITITTEPTGHGIIKSPLVSSPVPTPDTNRTFSAWPPQQEPQHPLFKKTDHFSFKYNKDKSGQESSTAPTSEKKAPTPRAPTTQQPNPAQQPVDIRPIARISPPTSQHTTDSQQIPKPMGAPSIPVLPNPKSSGSPSSFPSPSPLTAPTSEKKAPTPRVPTTQQPNPAQQPIDIRPIARTSPPTSQRATDSQQIPKPMGAPSIPVLPNPKSSGSPSSLPSPSPLSNNANEKLPPVTPKKNAPQTASSEKPKPQTFQAIESERKRQLAESKEQYYKEKHDLKGSMPRSQERKELIREEQKERHARDQQINDEALREKWQLESDNIVATLERQDALQKEKGESSQPPPPQKAKGGPTPAQVAAIVAARIAADRINQANNIPHAGPVPPTTIHIDPTRGGKRPF